MRFSLILLLAIYPLANLPVMTSLIFRGGRDISKGTSPGEAEDNKRQRARNEALLLLSSYGFLSCFALWWLHIWNIGADELGFGKTSFLSSGFHGAFVGMAWLGIWFMARLLPTSHQLSQREVPGLGGSWVQKIGVSLGGAFAEELWRVTCLAVLSDAGQSVESSLIFCAVAFALGFSLRGLRRSILAGIEGVVLGGLFVWLHSFWAPFAAHLAIQVTMLFAVGRYAEEQLPGHATKCTFPLCPACAAHLNRGQIEMRGVFRCPSCREKISVSAGYRNARRFLGGAAYLFLLFFSEFTFMGRIPGVAGVFGSIFFAYGATTTALIVIEALFPVKLERGDTEFTCLDLGERRVPPSMRRKGS
jgi:Type II CAAX prenyl endopeptidase Rce1-like